jgi:biotin carboxyl carrier protein
MIKKLRVTVDGKSFDVTVELAEDGAAPAVAPPPPPSAAAPSAPPPPPPPPKSAPEAVRAAPSAPGSGDIPSPLAGRVIAIIVQAGQQVKENDHLLTVEAMKMNTFVMAPKAGKVAQINVAVGDAVEEGQALARIE